VPRGITGPPCHGGDTNTERPGPPGEVKTGTNLAEFSKEGYASKRFFFSPIKIMMEIVINFLVLLLFVGLYCLKR
jgi:hypothetical protein